MATYTQLLAILPLTVMMLFAGYLAGQLQSAGPQLGLDIPVAFLAQSEAQPSLVLDANASAAVEDETLDFDQTRLSQAALFRLRKALDRRKLRPVASLTAKDGLETYLADAEELRIATAAVLTDLGAAFDTTKHKRLQRALALLSDTHERLHAVELAATAPAADHLGSHVLADAASGAGELGLQKKKGEVIKLVTVEELPFGMHVLKGTTTVDEVLPGLPAKKLGVRRGCQIVSIGGRAVSPGTWLMVFQSSKVPFKVKFNCGSPSSSVKGSGLHNAEVEDVHHYRVQVTKKPYGLNIQAFSEPRVVEVLPGYPGEAAGIRPSFVLTEVDDEPVNATTWFTKYQSAKLPFSLTFDTDAPVQKNNPYFKIPGPEDVGAFDEGPVRPPPGAERGPLGGEETDGGMHRDQDPVPTANGFEDFRCNVWGHPFGMQLASPPGVRPHVISVTENSPAFVEGVKVDDVLVEVAGIPVTSDTWFAAMAQAASPYGLLFRRPTRGRDRRQGEKEGNK